MTLYQIRNEQQYMRIYVVLSRRFFLSKIPRESLTFLRHLKESIRMNESVTLPIVH